MVIVFYVMDPVFTAPPVSFPDVAVLDTSEPLCPSAYPTDQSICYLLAETESQKYPTFAVQWQDRFNDVTISSTRVGNYMKKVEGFHLTLNGKSMWELMMLFSPYAMSVSSSEALKSKGYSDTVLMKKMIVRIRRKLDMPGSALLGDISFDGRGRIYAFTGSTGWQEVGVLKVDESGTLPVIDVPITFSNDPNPMKPVAARVGDFFVSLFDGCQPGLFAYEKQSDGTWADRSSRFEFTKHIEVPLSCFPNSIGGGVVGLPSMVYVREASCYYDATNRFHAYSWWGAIISTYDSPYTNGYEVTIDSSDDPTTFVMDANAMLAGSPVAQSSFDGAFSFMILNSGSPLGYTYSMLSSESGCASWSLKSGKALPYTEHVDFIGDVTHDPPNPTPGSERRKSGMTGSVVPTISIKSGAVLEDGEYRFRILDSEVLMPYTSVIDNYRISEGWLYPEVLYPGAYRVWYSAADVRRRLYSRSSNDYVLFDTEHPDYATDNGGFGLIEVEFPTEPYSWSDNDFCDDGRTLFPHGFVYTEETAYHCQSISAGVAMRFAAKSGGTDRRISIPA